MKLGMLSEGYSGSDINVVVRDAIMQPVRTLQNAQMFKQIPVPDETTGATTMKWTPCAPGDPAGRPMTLMDVPPAELHVPSITYYDFEKAIAHSRPSVSESDIKEHIKFTSEFGQEGN